MHPSVYRDFHLSLSPGVEPRELAAGVIVNEAVLYVMMRHNVTGEEAAFKLLGSTGSPERWIEEQVLRRFPDSDAAAALRTLYGVTRHRLKHDWMLAFGDRIYASTSELRTSKGARFWAELIPTLPPVLYSTMNARAVSKLAALGPELELRTVIKTVHDAWLSVLREARSLTMSVTGLQRLALDVSGWPTQHLQGLSVLEYGQLREKAMFARLALGYLTDEDWSAILGASLEPALAKAPT